MARPQAIFRGVTTSTSTPAAIWSVLVDPDRLPEWLAGAKDVQAAEGYPAVGGRVSFRVGPFRLAERVLERQAPGLFRVMVDSPLLRGTVTHRITKDADGARYEKVVEAEWKGFFRSLLGRIVLGRNVPREVMKLARVAESSRPAPGP